MESKNFPEIIEYHAKKYPYKTFCIEYSTETQVTYAEFDRYINQCCNFLEQKGIKSGDKVTVVLDNHLIMIIIYFATLRMNAAINPLPGTLSYDEIKKSVEILDSDMLFVEMSHFSEKADFIKNVYYLDENHGLFYDELKTFPSNFKKVLIKDESIACFYHTSGTTSNPKCIMYTHKNMVSLIHSMTVSFRFKFDDIHIGFLPLGHTAITNYSLLPVIYNASTLILCENFMKIRAEFWKIVNRFKATYVEMVPTLLFMMLNTPYDQADIENNKTLKYVGCGSAPLSLDTQLDYKEKFGI
jgi:acyl-coenzyme A synthetase/AMP-(fatty) acid ligase